MNPLEFDALKLRVGEYEIGNDVRADFRLLLAEVERLRGLPTSGRKADRRPGWRPGVVGE